MVFATHGSTIDDACRHIDAGNPVAAEQIAQGILARSPKDLGATRVMGLAAALRRDINKSVSLLKRCIAMAPGEWVLYRDLGKVYLEAGRFEEGLEAYNKALKLKPDDEGAIVGKADLFEKSGRHDEARAFLRPFEERGELTFPMVAILSKLELRDGRCREAIKLIEPHLTNTHRPPREIGMLLQTLAQCHEKLGDVDRAFEAYSKAKAAQALPFDRKKYEASVDAMMSIFTRANLARVPKARDITELPVMIASMPRSGSTLVEQIIHAHPQAFGGGELPYLPQIAATMQEEIGSIQSFPECIADITQSQVDALGARYLKEVKRLAPGKKRIVDKGLDNYRYLGLIQLLLPGARVIHVHKEPLDNCFGIFMANLDADRVRYSTDLQNIAFAYRQYQRLMEHWREELDLKLLDVPYESLVEDSEGWIRKIIAFCGLSWSDQCLRYYEVKRDVITLSYDQVRKPIFKSAVKRWKKYEAHLGTLKSALGVAGD